MNPKYPSAEFADLFRRRLHRLSDHHRPGNARFTWNGRAALFQLLSALPKRRGVTVLVPAYHCIALTQPILAAGFTIECYRVRPDLTIDIEDLVSRLRADVVAVLVIHYFGFPADLDGVQCAVRAHGAVLIEDCSHSFLTRDRGACLGQRGDYSVFSYYKCTASLVGGALVANGGAPLPAIPCDSAPWPVQLAVVRRWLQQANARAPKQPMRLLDRVLRSMVGRGFARFERATARDKGNGGTEMPPAGFLDMPYLFNPSLARAGLPAYVQRIIEASPWEDIANARRRNYAVWSRLIPDSPMLRRPQPDLPDGVVPYMFPLLFRDRRRHEAPLREAGIPYLRFGDVLDRSVEHADDAARRDAQYLSGSMIVFPVHQDLDERRIEAYVKALLDYVAQLPIVHEHTASSVA